MSMRALLDVNVLIALLDSNHLHYDIAQQWVKGHTAGFATGPLTSYALGARGEMYSYPSLFGLLKDSLEAIDHLFLVDSVSLLNSEIFNHNNIHSHKQLTDIYLLALAAKHNCTLLTFDQHIALNTVLGADKKHLSVLR
jgi:uncharacterized protein